MGVANPLKMTLTSAAVNPPAMGTWEGIHDHAVSAASTAASTAASHNRTMKKKCWECCVRPNY